jgi:signal transduction histidine kinase
MERLLHDQRTILQWAEMLVPSKYLSDERNLRKARLMILFYLTTAIFLIGFAVLYHLIDYRLGVWACIYGAAVVPLLLFVFHRTGSFGITSAVFDINAIVMFSMLIYGTGGINSSIVPWLAIVPASGFVFDGWKRGLMMSIVCFAEIVALYILETGGNHLPQLFNTEHVQLLNLVVQLGLMAYIFMILLIYEISRERTIKQLDALNTDLSQRKREVELQREALSESNVQIANINADLERKVASRTAKLQQAKKELDTFLYEAAHALRRPVARIMGLVSILRSEPENTPTALAMQDHIDRSTALMDQMLHKLIIVSEIDSRPVTTENINVADFCRAMIEERAEEFQKAGCQLELELPKNIRLETDPFLLQVVITHLLDNAIQYSAKTGRKPEISIRGTKTGQQFILQIQDNGLGIPATELSRVTEMFFRATEKVPGGGLGLYLVQKAADKMGGTLSIASELGVGTTVELNLALSAEN